MRGAWRKTVFAWGNAAKLLLPYIIDLFTRPILCFHWFVNKTNLQRGVYAEMLNPNRLAIWNVLDISFDKKPNFRTFAFRTLFSFPFAAHVNYGFWPIINTVGNTTNDVITASTTIGIEARRDWHREELEMRPAENWIGGGKFIRIFTKVQDPTRSSFAQFKSWKTNSPILGPRSSGQRARFLLRWSELESHRRLQFSLKCLLKRTEINRKWSGWVHSKRSKIGQKIKAATKILYFQSLPFYFCQQNKISR